MGNLNVVLTTIAIERQLELNPAMQLKKNSGTLITFNLSASINRIKVGHLFVASRKQLTDNKPFSF
jgi:hypothetical protein